MKNRFLIIFLSLFIVAPAWAQDQQGYQQPSDDIVRLLDAPAAPSVSVSPDGRFMAITERPNMPSLEDLSQPMLRLAGMRISPQTNSTFMTRAIDRITLKDLETLEEREVQLPENPAIAHTSWSLDGRWFTFSLRDGDGLYLHAVDARTGEVQRLLPNKLNAVYGSPYDWQPGGELLVRIVPEGREDKPAPPAIPGGPTTQQTDGTTRAVRTFQDLLQSPHDEALLDYYFTSQLVRLNAESGEKTPLGEPAIFADATASPDGNYILVNRIVQPYTYFMPVFGFAREVEIWDRNGNLAQHLFSTPVAEDVPIGGVQTGPRSVRWDPHADARLLWTEALDEGNPRAEVDHRDRLMALEEPFNAEPAELFRTEYRFSGIQFTEDGNLAFVSDFDRPTRHTRTLVYEWPQIGEPRELVDRLTEDRYADPGNFVTTTLPNGFRAVMLSEDGRSVFLRGQGASPEGDRPFLHRLSLDDFEPTEIFRSENPYYETVVDVLSRDGNRFITSRESETDAPNFYLRDAAAGSMTALTDIPDPQPVFREIEKRMVTYRRSDGVQLSATLYLPPDYEEGERRPAMIWAYPREFATADAAGQVTGSPNRFTRVGGSSHLFLLLEGYVVLDAAAMPILGGELANDTFVEQLIDNASSAINFLDSLGVADPSRIGVGGHSYGAFMTANLLAHSDLFRAGIARSGAYNRTLTPFGFQNERRTYWEAPEIYNAMSPFMHAHKIDTPILLLHGAEDNNSGTFPIQSERMYHALMGHGKTARLVMLPLESHGYQARESVLHAIYEQNNWMNRFVRDGEAPLSAAGEK